MDGGIEQNPAYGAAQTCKQTGASGGMLVAERVPPLRGRMGDFGEPMHKGGSGRCTMGSEANITRIAALAVLL